MDMYYRDHAVEVWRLICACATAALTLAHAQEGVLAKPGTLSIAVGHYITWYPCIIASLGGSAHYMPSHFLLIRPCHFLLIRPLTFKSGGQP